MKFVILLLSNNVTDKIRIILRIMEFSRKFLVHIDKIHCSFSMNCLMIIVDFKTGGLNRTAAQAIYMHWRNGSVCHARTFLWLNLS